MNAARYSKILDLINIKDIKTQGELTKELKKSGMNVTQATVSRDIKKLGLIKAMSSNGVFKYVATSPYDTFLTGKLVKILSQSVVNLDVVGNMIVVKTISGTASAAAEAIDNLNCDGISGTLAGNNSIFILARNEVKANDICKYIEKMIKIKD